MHNSKKILVIGSCGAGKSTFTRKLNDKTGLPLIHLDTLYWKPNWERTPREGFRLKVKELIEQDKWIIDGNYRNTLDLRIPAADTIIWLDLSRWICLWRIIKRRITKVRADKIIQCEERLTLELVK